MGGSGWIWEECVSVSSHPRQDHGGNQEGSGRASDPEPPSPPRGHLTTWNGNRPAPSAGLWATLSLERENCARPQCSQPIAEMTCAFTTRQASVDTIVSFNPNHTGPETTPYLTEEQGWGQCHILPPVTHWLLLDPRSLGLAGQSFPTLHCLSCCYCITIISIS